MILTPHILVGAVIGAKIHSFGAIFVLALLSHFLFDRLPHWDYLEQKLDQIKGKKLVIFWFKVAADLSFGSFLIWYFFHSSPDLIYILFGILMGVLPDGLCVLDYLLKHRLRILKRLQAWHYAIHIPDNKNPLLRGLIVEGLLVAIIIIFLLF